MISCLSEKNGQIDLGAMGLENLEEVTRRDYRETARKKVRYRLRWYGILPPVASVRTASEAHGHNVASRTRILEGRAHGIQKLASVS